MGFRIRPNAEQVRREKERARAQQERPHYDTPLRQSDSDNNRPYHWSLHNQHDVASAYVPPQEMTKATYRQLEQERDELTSQLDAAARVVQEANSDGTHLRDNSSFRAAEEERGRIEAERNRVESILRHAIIVTEVQGKAKGNGIGVGCTVLVKLDGDELTYTIVHPNDSSPRKGRISCESPVGRALMGHKAGDAFEITTPAAILPAVIVSVRSS